MGLTAEQTKGLQDQFKQLRAGGMDAPSATAKIKELASGMITRPQMGPDGRPLDPNGYRYTLETPATATPVVPNASVPPLPTPDAPRGQSPKVDGTPVNPPAPAATAPVTVNPSVNSTPATLNATAGQTDSTGQIVPPGMTSFDTSAGKNLSQLNPTVNAPAPVATSPVAPTPSKPTVIAPEKAQEIDRSREIMSNLQEGQKNSPQLFKDEATFKQAYGYDGKPVEEQAQLDAFWKAQNKRSADQLIDMALARQDLTPYKGTPEFLTAQRVGKAVLDYSKMTPPLLAERMGAMEADILPGSKAYAVLSKANPQLVAEAERIRDANRRSGIMGYDENGKATANRIPDAETNISDSLTNGVAESAIPSLAAALKTPEITKAREAASATKTQLNELYDTVESVEDDVRSELKGTGATESYIRALISERTKPLMKQVNSLERKYANEAGDLKTLSDAATDGFKYSWQAASEERQMAREKGLLAYKKTLESDGKTNDLVDLGGKKVLIEKGTGKVVATFDVSKPLTDQFEFRSETDSFGNQTTAVYEKATGKRVTSPVSSTETGADYSQAVSYLAGAGYETSPAIIKSLAGKSIDEIRQMYPAREGMTVSGKPQNEGQVLATGFAERIGRSNAGIEKLNDYISGLSDAEFYTYSNQYTPNLVKPAKYQQFDQYAREFITSQLRKESGAAISNEEWATARQQYFPMPGDSPEVISQKKESRDAAYSNMVKASGLKAAPSTQAISASPAVATKFRAVGTTTDNTNQLKTLSKTNPLDAGPKYNNLGGISFRGANGKEFGFNETLRKAGIPFSEGGVRGVGGKEQGTYVKFPSVGDGVDAYNLLWKTNSYQGMKVSDAMNKWGTGSVGLPKEMLSKKVSEIDKATLSKIKALQISKESPAMFQYLKDNGLLKNL